MGFPDAMKQRARELASKYKAKRIVRILETEFKREFEGMSDSSKLRDVYRWMKDENTGPKNWIDKHQARYGKLPIIPKRIGVLFEDYSPRMRVLKKLRLKKAPPSMQYWKQVLLPSERKKFLELLQWLGQDAEDYEETIRRYTPGTSSGPIHINRKRKMA